MTTMIRDDGKVLAFDATLEIRFSPANNVTSNPIEGGAVVSDHIQELQLPFTVVGLVSESPIAPAPPPSFGRVNAAITFFEGSPGRLFTVQTIRDGTFLNCAVESWPHTITKELSRVFSVTFRQLKIALGVSITIPARIPAPPAQTGAPDAIDVGTQPTTSVEPGAGLTSALFTATGGF